MADFRRVAVIGDRRLLLIGSSTDTKPTEGIPDGSEAYETDTGVAFILDEGEWVADLRSTLVVIKGGAHIDAQNGLAVVEQGQFDFVDVAAGSDVALGTGAAGDFLHKVHVETGCTAVAVKHNGATIYTWTTATGETEKEFNMRSTVGGWTLNAAGGGALAVGRFTA